MIFYIVGFCVGLRLASDPGMIFHDLEKVAEMLPGWLSKPLIQCVTCMAGPWGTLIYTAHHYDKGISFEVLMQYPLVILSAAALNTLLYNAIEFFRANKLEP